MANLTFFKRMHMAGLVLGALALYLISPESKTWGNDISIAMLAIFVNAFFLRRIHMIEAPAKPGRHFWRGLKFPKNR